MQTYFKHGMGDTVTLYFEIFKNNVGQTGETPTVAIQKKSTSEWITDTLDGWQVGYSDVSMNEVNATNLAGVYTLDISHIDVTAETYNIYMKNGGMNAPGNDFEAHYFSGAVYVPPLSTYGTGTVLGNLNEMKNKDGGQTFDRTKHSLEVVGDLSKEASVAGMGNYTIVGTQLILKDIDDTEIARWDLAPNVDNPISRIRV